MATSSSAADIAKRLLLKNLPPEGVRLPGNAADIQDVINYAEQQAWIGKRPGDQYYRLTEAGVRAGQPSAYNSN
jgi:hypothetical protein